MACGDEGNGFVGHGGNRIERICPIMPIENRAQIPIFMETQPGHVGGGFERANTVYGGVVGFLVLCC